jgi:hypothetical protein
MRPARAAGGKRRSTSPSPLDLPLCSCLFYFRVPSECLFGSSGSCTRECESITSHILAGMARHSPLSGNYRCPLAMLPVWRVGGVGAERTAVGRCSIGHLLADLLLLLAFIAVLGPYVLTNLLYSSRVRDPVRLGSGSSSHAR